MAIFECSRCNEPTHARSADSVAPCPRCGFERHRVAPAEPGGSLETPRELALGDHASLVYHDPSMIALFCARYLTEGIDRGERVMAALIADLRETVVPLLAPDVNVLIEWADPYAIYGDFDADRVAGMYDALIGAEPRTVRILAAVDHVCAEDVDPSETDRYEQLAHAIVTEHGATAVCLYDSRGLGEEFLAAARTRHALRVVDGVPRRNEAFEYQPA